MRIKKHHYIFHVRFYYDVWLVILAHLISTFFYFIILFLQKCTCSNAQKGKSQREENFVIMKNRLLSLHCRVFIVAVPVGSIISSRSIDTSCRSSRKVFEIMRSNWSKTFYFCYHYYNRHYYFIPPLLLLPLQLPLPPQT